MNNKINLCISFSQQTKNKCAVGDTEQDHSYEIAQKLYSRLKELHSDELNLFITIKRNGRDDENLINTVKDANNFFIAHGKKGYFFEIHTDAGGYGTGASALYVSSAGLVFMREIFKEIEKITPWEDIGLRRRTNLHALKSTIVPAGILELSFHDNPREAKWIHENMDKIVDALIHGIEKSLNLRKTKFNMKWMMDTVKRLDAFHKKHYKEY